jgi:hypothetical protein
MTMTGLPENDDLTRRLGPELVAGVSVSFRCAQPDCDATETFEVNQIVFRGEGYNGQPYIDIAAAIGLLERKGWTVDSHRDESMSVSCPAQKPS